MKRMTKKERADEERAIGSQIGTNTTLDRRHKEKNGEGVFAPNNKQIILKFNLTVLPAQFISILN